MLRLYFQTPIKYKPPKTSVILQRGTSNSGHPTIVLSKRIYFFISYDDYYDDVISNGSAMLASNGAGSVCMIWITKFAERFRCFVPETRATNEMPRILCCVLVHYYYY